MRTSAKDPSLLLSEQASAQGVRVQDLCVYEGRRDEGGGSDKEGAEWEREAVTLPSRALPTLLPPSLLAPSQGEGIDRREDEVAEGTE